ncbi:MAG: metallophosphoesterase [Clostridia bacterium]|nr:metallophosphoesterase [Clostridia bacterium]
MKTMKKSISILLALLMLISCFGTASAADVTEQQWNDSWNAQDSEYLAAVTMFPGSDESERYVAWYSESADGYVELTSSKGTEKIAAAANAAPEGDYRLSALITGLTEGSYSYRCVSGDYTSETYEFTVENYDSFTALYVSDIHSSNNDESNANRLRDTNYNYNRMLEKAKEKALSKGTTLDLIVSGGDQAGEGLRCEFEGLSSPEMMKEYPFAIAVGNHDRKSVGYKYYTAVPNESETMNFKSYIGNDYWFRQGNALFLMLDSCNTSMPGHYLFMKKAVKENPDAKWIIAVMHHDMFGGREEWLYSENALLRLLWTPLFDEFGVDLCLYGHSHYYSVSNVIYDNKTVQGLAGASKIKNPEGTIYLSSGAINNLAPLLTDEGEIPPIGENAAFTFLEEEIIYNLLDFSGDSLTIKSYTVDSDEEFYSLEIEKTGNQGGHQLRNSKPLVKLLFWVTRIVNVINNIDMYNRYKEQGFDVSLKEGLIGS